MSVDFKQKVLLDQNYLKDLASKALDCAKKLGACECEISLSSLEGISISTRSGDVENIEFNKDRSMDICVYKDSRQGVASTSDFTDGAIEKTVRAALDIANYTDKDPVSYVIEKQYLSNTNYDFENAFEIERDTDSAVDKAIALERQYLDNPVKNIKKSDGASLSSTLITKVEANSNGFIGAKTKSSNGRSISLLGELNDKMQTGYGFSINCNPNLLYSNKDIVCEAVTKTLDKLDATSIKTDKYNVIFKDSAAMFIWSTLTKAIRGGLLYKDSSFLCNTLDTKIFPNYVSLIEDPFVKGSGSSSNFDGEGAQVYKNDIIKDGILNMYLLGSYSARKLKLKPNGHASYMGTLLPTFDKAHTCSFDDMLKDVSEGIVITSLMGQGVNITNGDVSRGASGYYFKDGKRVHALEEITVAFNLKDLFLSLSMMSNDDIDERYSIKTGSILVENVTISGI